MAHESGADVLISVGGGSPIDSAKLVSYRIHEENTSSSSWIPIIAVPTTLSVAETTQGAGFTDEEGNKAVAFGAELAPKGMVQRKGGVKILFLTKNCFSYYVAYFAYFDLVG